MANNTITVGCKLPHGLHLDIGDRRVTIDGTNAATIINGHGITENVDEEFFTTWMVGNSEHPAVVNELIFAHGKAESVKAHARNNAKNKSGFEGIDPNKPGDGVTRADEQPK